jgi:hypothetical protein
MAGRRSPVTDVRELVRRLRMGEPCLGAPAGVRHAGSASENEEGFFARRAAERETGRHAFPAMREKGALNEAARRRWPRTAAMGINRGR